MNEIVAKLREYNRWRRGDEEIAQPDPGEIGRLLDAVCEMVGQLERERDLAEDERIDLAQQLQSEKERHAKCQNERDEAKEAYDTLATKHVLVVNQLVEECNEARENLRILAGLVAYGLGQSGEEWSLEAMRQATAAIQNAKALEEAK